MLFQNFRVFNHAGILAVDGILLTPIPPQSLCTGYYACLVPLFLLKVDWWALFGIVNWEEPGSVCPNTHIYTNYLPQLCPQQLSLWLHWKRLGWKGPVRKKTIGFLFFSAFQFWLTHHSLLICGCAVLLLVCFDSHLTFTPIWLVVDWSKSAKSSHTFPFDFADKRWLQVFKDQKEAFLVALRDKYNMLTPQRAVAESNTGDNFTREFFLFCFVLFFCLFFYFRCFSFWES